MICVIFVAGVFHKNNQFDTQSENLKIIPVGDGTYIHESYLQTDDFGKVACNGLIYASDGEAVIFDTPVDTIYSNILINWLTDSLGYSIKAIIPTHFHNDCLGGIPSFHDEKIPSIAHQKTIDLAEQHNLPVPEVGFTSDTTLLVGSEKVIITFPGQGHTADNVVAYIESNQVLFGGCLIKSLGAGKGFTGDANLDSWAHTVKRIKANFPQIELVVPGHGEAGNQDLLDYTIDLFDSQSDQH